MLLATFVPLDIHLYLNSYSAFINVYIYSIPVLTLRVLAMYRNKAESSASRGALRLWNHHSNIPAGHGRSSG